MKNNSEIVNNTMCKSCLREHKEMTGYEPIDCAFKAFDNEYCEEAQKLTDYITKQDNKWQKLKEWLEEIKLWNEKQMKEARLNLDYYIRAKSQNVFINKMLDKMQELEGEKDD